MDRFTDLVIKKTNELKKLQFDKIDELGFFNDLADALIKNGNQWYRIIAKNSLFIGYFRTINNKISFDELYEKVSQIKDTINSVNGNLKIYNKDLDNFELDIKDCDLSIFGEYKEDALKVLEKILYIEFYLKFEEAIKEFKGFDELTINKNLFDKKVFNRTTKKSTRKMNSKLRNNFEIDNFKSNIISYRNNLQKEYNKFISNRNKAINSYIDLLKNLKGLLGTKNIIILDQNLISLAQSDEVKYELYRVAAKYNEYYYKYIKSSNEELKKHSSSFFSNFFFENNLNFNNYSDEYKEIISKQCDIEFLKKLIDSKIINENILYSNIGVAILICSNINILNNVLNLVDKSIINYKIIELIPGVLIDKNSVNEVKPLYNKLLNLTDIIEKYNFKINEDNCKYLFNASCEDLIKYFEFINEYELDLDNYYLLNDINSIYKIDEFIELGLHDYIISNLKYLKYPFITDRIMICNYLNIDIFNDNKIKSSITSGNNFYVDNESLDDYIVKLSDYYEFNEINCSNDYLEIVKKLDSKYKINNNVYLIDDIYLSRNRVIRNLKEYHNKLDYESLIKYSIVKNSMLDKNSFEKIITELNSKVYKK